MSTAISPYSSSSLYEGPNKDRPLGQIVRSLVRDGRSVVRAERLRWQESREFYRGNQWLRAGQDQRTARLLARSSFVPPGRPAYNAYNRLRSLVDARTALLAKERPPYEIVPEDNDPDSIDGARQAEKFVAARWGPSGWNIATRLSELVKNSDIDGLAWLFVDWDPSYGKSVDQDIALRADGQPITSRAEYEALKAQDPQMQSMWRMGRSPRPLGDVCWRVVLPGALSVDPFAVKSFEDADWIAESRVRPRWEIERRLGTSFKEAVRGSAASTSGRSGAQVQYEDLVIDDGGGTSTVMSESDGVVVHYFYARPCARFPRGLRMEVLDRAPDKPLLIDEWRDELPYFCLVARPDPGHFLRSRSITDDLKPIQRDFNQTLRDLRIWLSKVATMPIGIPVNSLRSESLFNEDGYYEYVPAMGEPHHMNLPPEPTGILTSNLVWMSNEMDRIAGVSALSQGFTSAGGPFAAAAINMAIQQTEQNLSELESNLRTAIEWGVSRSLRLVQREYTLPRMVIGVGVDDAERFAAFTGALLRGAHRFRINGPMMPKSKAARMQSIFQLAPMLGDTITPYIAQLIDGDPTEMQRDVELDRQHQKGETRAILGLATNQQALAVYQNFESDKQAFSKAFNIAARSGQDPMAVLGQQGIIPPNLTQAMQTAGIDVPMVEDFNNHAMELKALDDFRKGDAYTSIHPMCKQLLREHADQHKAQMRQQLQSMAQQQPMGQQAGSPPAPKGTPSPPKQTRSERFG